MTKYVIGPDVALRLAKDNVQISDDDSLLAPTLMRSQFLSLLYGEVRAGKMTKDQADQYLGYVRGLRIRLLGDRVLQNVAWDFADRLGCPDTFIAEYLALTNLQADSFITLNEELVIAVKDVIPTAPFEVLSKD